MEYIREMLLRQRTALARLLLGGGPEEGAASAPAAVRQKEMAPAERGTGPAGTASDGQGVLRGAAADAAGEAAGMAALAGETLGQALARKSTARERAALSSLADGTAGSLLSAYRRAAGGGGLSSGGGREGETAAAPPGFQRPGEADSGAKALSRAFQRDARRYDGGFQLYD